MKREEEKTSDVQGRPSEARLNALQQRGEKRIMTSDGLQLLVRVDQTRCMGAESCVTVAPSVFSLDVRQLGLGRRGKEPLGMKNVAERTVDGDTIILAGHSCPYHAIYIQNLATGEEIAGW